MLVKTAELVHRGGQEETPNNRSCELSATAEMFTMVDISLGPSVVVGELDLGPGQSKEKTAQLDRSRSASQARGLAVGLDIAPYRA